MLGNRGPQLSRPVKNVLLAVAAAAVAAALFFAGYFTYYLTLDDGLRSLLWVKKTADEQYYQAIDDDAFWQAAIDGAVSSLDKYSAYYTDVEYDQQTDADKGILAGMGASFFAGSNKISKVAIGSPLFFAQSDADFAGGWVTGIARAEGEVQNTFTLTALSAQMKGLGAGDTVSVRISSEGAEDTDAATCSVVQVTFAQYHESYVLYAVKGRAYAVLYGEDGEGVWTDVSAYTSLDERVPEGRAYLRLVQFNGGAAEEFAAAAEQYKADGVSALLFDLRNDGGGRLDILQRIAAYFIADSQEKNAVVMRARYRSGQETVSRAAGNHYAEFFGGSEIFVAANGNTASASEALLGVMIDYGAIGFEDIYITDTVQKEGYSAATYGKGIMQTTFVNRGTGEAFKLTTAQIYWPAGRSIHGVGITVGDGAVASPAASFGEYGDPELDSIFSAVSARADQEK